MDVQYVRMQYDFEPSEDPAELGVRRGAILHRLPKEEGHNDGWALVENSDGEKGFVPEEYLTVETDEREIRLFETDLQHALESQTRTSAVNSSGPCASDVGRDVTADAAVPPSPDRVLDITASSSGMTAPGVAPESTDVFVPGPMPPPPPPLSTRSAGSTVGTGSGSPAAQPTSAKIPLPPPPPAAAPAPPAAATPQSPPQQPAAPVTPVPVLTTLAHGARLFSTPSTAVPEQTTAVPHPRHSTGSLYRGTSVYSDTFKKNEAYYHGLVKQRADVFAKFDASLGEAAAEIAGVKERSAMLMSKVQELRSVVKADKVRWAEQADDERKVVQARLADTLTDPLPLPRVL